MAHSVESEFRGARRRLIETLQDKGIKDLAVLRAIDQVPRHEFVPPSVRHRAYEDSALPIGSGQTISQPFVHARALEQLLLTGRERVLEIGTGSAYQTALLAELLEAKKHDYENEKMRVKTPAGDTVTVTPFPTVRLYDKTGRVRVKAEYRMGTNGPAGLTRWFYMP